MANHSTEGPFTISYPRRRATRALTRRLGRLLIRLVFRVTVTGQENFPPSGPLLVAGNHAAAMEAVLMVLCTPWQVEILGASDVPHERVTQLAMSIYGYIPVNRGNFDRRALIQALDVLKQGGVVAVFPEGGIWDAGRMRAQTGVAWLSYRAAAPVLPIGFGRTTGALGAALRLKRPRVTVRIGRPIPAASLPKGEPRKPYLEAYATKVVDAIRALLPADDPAHQPGVIDERFELRVSVATPDGRPASCPEDRAIRHSPALAKLLHSPPVLKIFTTNLQLPTRPLQELDQEPPASKIFEAVRSILDYLDEENPHLLNYRFGPRQGKAMRVGLEELLALARWAAGSSVRLRLVPVRRYTPPDGGDEVVQTEQVAFEGWM